MRNGICTGLFGIFCSGIVAFRPVPSFRRRPPAVSAIRPKVSATVIWSPITALRNASSPTLSTSSLSPRSNSTFGVALASVKPPESVPTLRCVFDASPKISGVVRLNRMPICDVPVSVGAVSGGSGSVSAGRSTFSLIWPSAASSSAKPSPTPSFVFSVVSSSA